VSVGKGLDSPKAATTSQSKIVAVSPSKQMLEQTTQNSKTPFSQGIFKTTFMNTRPMYMGPRSRQPSPESKSKPRVDSETNGDATNPASQERLESLEMREAIYKSHGIMTSADKNLFQGQSKFMKKHQSVNRARGFASGSSRYQTINEQLVNQAEAAETL